MPRIKTLNKYTVPGLIVLYTLFAIPDGFSDDTKVERLYQQHCSSCHGLDRLGGVGPALLPQNLRRLKRDTAAEVISNGAAATQMPAFKANLTKSDIESLVEFIYRPYMVALSSRAMDASCILRPAMGGFLNSICTCYARNPKFVQV